MKKTLVMDIECYVNYFLVMFKLVGEDKVIHFESFNDSPINIRNVLHILQSYTIVTFNGNKYDIVMLEAMSAGYDNETLKRVSQSCIEDKMQPWQVRKQYGFTAIKVDHIDLIEVAPLKASLKIYGGRLKCRTLKDLPIHHEDIIVESDLEPMRLYCKNDLEVTELLFNNLEGELALRTEMTKEYGVDLRSKSDAQIAEAVIKREFKEKHGIDVKKPKIATGTEFMYQCPDSITFTTDELIDIHSEFILNPFVVGKSGHIELPKVLKNRKFKLGNTTYKIGVGGLHSCEKSTRHTSEDCILRDYDVAAYYPNIILNNSLTPIHLGQAFLHVYKSIVDRRLKAKAEGNKVVNESLKITINGSFGKLASKWSFLYAPDLMMQVTVTGQLTLLMLIERLELAGVSVVSANTDGIVVKTKVESCVVEDIVADWEMDTDYEMEPSDYISLNSRDVNNYIAVKKGGVKGKGAFAESSLKINPSNEICVEAVKKYLQDGIDVSETIYNCTDISKFVTLRTVTGGAEKEGYDLGKAIRWYYGHDELDAIFYVKSGNKVPKSDGGVPIMEFDGSFPDDVDFDWYIAESKSILENIGLTQQG